MWYKNEKYNLLTLRPHGKEERKALWDFRCEDIGRVFTFKVFYTMPFWSGFLLAFIVKPEALAFKQLVYFSLY